MSKSRDGILSTFGRMWRWRRDKTEDATSVSDFATVSQLRRLAEVLELPGPAGRSPAERSGGSGRPLVIVCGLEAEAKIARAPNALVLKGGGDQRKLAAALELAAPHARGIVSFGVAGGLAPGMSPGDVCVANAIVAPDGRVYPTDRTWSSKISEVLEAPLAGVVGVDRPLSDKAGKEAVRRATGADAVDMESHVVARVAARYGLPIAAVRVVTDPAERSLPHAATVGMRLDGRVDLRAILRSLALSPRQLPALIRTGLDARAAFAALLRCRQRLGPRFALLDLG